MVLLLRSYTVVFEPRTVVAVPLTSKKKCNFASTPGSLIVLFPNIRVSVLYHV